MSKYTFVSPAQAAQQQVDIPTPQHVESERAHLFTPAAGVWLPALQALMTGIIIGSAAWIYAYLLKSENWFNVGVIVGIFFMVISWLLFLLRWLALTKPVKFEKLTRLDLNGDGRIGQPVPMIRVMVTSEDMRHGIIAELPYADRLPQFAKEVLDGTPLSERNWSYPGKLFTPAEYREIIDAMMARSLLRWVNPSLPKSGRELTPYGRAALRAIAKGAPPTPLFPEPTEE